MNRKVKSIFLLLIFLVLVVHEMIPHHHHEHDANSKSYVSQQTEPDCHSSDLTSLEHSSCEIPENVSADNHHECPHHYHNCTVDNLEYNYASNSISVRKWNKSIDVFNSRLDNSTAIYSKCTEHTYSDISFHLYERFRKEAISLRAPPIVG